MLCCHGTVAGRGPASVFFTDASRISFFCGEKQKTSQRSTVRNLDWPLHEVLTNRAPTTALRALAAQLSVLAVVELNPNTLGLHAPLSFPPTQNVLACCSHVLQSSCSWRHSGHVPCLPCQHAIFFRGRKDFWKVVRSWPEVRSWRTWISSRWSWPRPNNDSGSSTTPEHSHCKVSR
jgi:hypothetical protein